MSIFFGKSRQLGIVIRDMTEAISAITEGMGIGPFFIVRELRPSWFRYRGADSQPPLLSLAFAYSGELQVELIQQHDTAPSAYVDFLASGREGPQHLSSWAASPAEYDAMYAQSVARAGTPIHEGQIGTGRFAYFDTIDPAIGLSFEIAETQLPAQIPIWERVKAASCDWDGGEPIRNLK